MTRLNPLLDRNERFGRTQVPSALGLPTAGLVVLTCLDHRVDPAIVLGLRLGEAPVLRNAGGRVTQAVIDDIVYLGFLTRRMTRTRRVRRHRSRSRSSSTRNAAPPRWPTPASVARPRPRRVSPKQSWPRRRSPTRTPPSPLVSNACSPRPASVAG